MATKKNDYKANAATAGTMSWAVQGDGEEEKPKKPKHYQISLRMPPEYRLYLQERAWQERTDITKYINALIAADIEQHPDWRDTLDETNV